MDMPISGGPGEQLGENVLYVFLVLHTLHVTVNRPKASARHGLYTASFQINLEFVKKNQWGGAK